MPSLRSPASALALALLLVAGPAHSTGAGVDGTRGLLRVHSADPHTPGYIAGSVYGMWAREWYPFQQSPRSQFERTDFGAAMLSIAYSPTPVVELSLRGVAEGQWVSAVNTGETGREIGTGDIAFTVKTLLTPASRKDWMLGAELLLAGATGNQKALYGSWDRDGLDVGGRLALTYANLDESGDANLRFHTNAGYLKRTSEFDAAAFAQTSPGGTVPRAVLHGDLFLYGAAFEVPVPGGWNVFAEWSGEYDMDADVEFADNPMRVTPGLRYSTRSGSFVWTTGYEISMASEEASPPWQWISGFSFGGYASPVSGRLLGVVRDAETGDPIPGAQIKLRSTDDPAVTSDSMGRFQTKVPKGFAVVELAAEGYNAKTRVVEMPGHETVEFDFTMVQRHVLGSLSGRVRDSETGSPLFARVRLADGGSWVETDPQTGEYRLEAIPEGEAAIEVEAPRYQTTRNSARVVADQMAMLDVSLARDMAATKGVLSGYVRDGASGEPIQAELTARGRSTMTVKSDPVTGLYELELEEGAWSVSAVGSGFVAQVESIEISAQEASVRNFDLSVLPRKMTLSGVYFDSGAATIKRESLTALDKAAQFLLDNDKVAVEILGHTDSMGNLTTNMALSQRRADSVMKFLVVNYGVNPKRLRAKGIGPREPIASNDTSEGRALNRRIEFAIEEDAAR